MINIVEKKQCCGCTACVNICPKKAIKMIEDEEGFKYPIIDTSKCVNCGLCDKVCQYIYEVDTIASKEDISVYACTLKDKKTNHSTTAGIFYNLGKAVIENGGFVCGAIYDKEMNVKHVLSNKIEDLEKMRGSKYVQSDLNNVYSIIKEYLNTDKKVLFSGTPCQVGGLYKYLQKKYDNLITIDIICYGVPSPKVYRDYVKKLKSKSNNVSIKYINFRDKNNGWQRPSTSIEYSDKRYNSCITSSKDEWYRTFISHITTRTSCNNCLYTSTIRKSDITLGDFWGIDKIRPDIDTFYGVEKVIINTKKGKNLFDIIKEKYNVYTMEIKDAIRPNLQRPPKKNPKREEYFKCYIKNGYEKAYNKFIKLSYKAKITIKIKSIIKKFFRKENK